MSEGIQVVIRGECDVRIGRTHVTAPNARCKFSRGVLTIDGTSGSSVCSAIGDGASVHNFFGSGASFSRNTFCCNGVEVNFSGDRLVISGRAPREIVVCGVPVPLPAQLRAAAADAPAVDFEIPPGHLVRAVTARGTGNVTLDDDAALDRAQFSATVDGMADIDLGRNTFDTLRARVSGTGDIKGAATAAVSALAASGAGDICGVHTTRRLDVVCSGTGDISVTASKDASVSKIRSGAGSIHIKTK